MSQRKDNPEEEIHELEHAAELESAVGIVNIHRLRVSGGWLYITTGKNLSAQIALDTEFVPEGMER